MSHAIEQIVASLRTGASDSQADPDIARMVASCTEPFVLVLDDIHHLESEASATLLSQVTANLAPSSTLVLVGRAHHHAKAIARFQDS